MSRRVFAHKSDAKSPVVQSAHLQDDVISRLQQTQAGLRQATPGQYLDLTQYDPDAYIHALNTVATLKQRFAALPSALRAACLNDPRQLLVLAADAKSGDEMSVALLKRYGLSVTPPELAKEPAKEGSGDGSIPLE